MNNLPEKLLKATIKNTFTNYTHPPYELEKELLRHLRNMDEDQCCNTLEKINTFERANLSNLPIRSLKNSKICSCTLFIRIIIDAGVDPETAFVFSDYYINLIDNCTNIPELEAIEFTIIKDCIKLLQKIGSYQYSSHVNKAIYYVNKNILQKLVLVDIANYIHLHPNYLSKIFKQEVGIPIYEYIIKSKITLIKQFLKDTSLSIIDIGFYFNFQNLSNFSAFFKKHTSHTPSEYRRMHKHV